MESQTKNPEFRDNPENFHPCGLHCHSIAIFYISCQVVKLTYLNNRKNTVRR